MWSILSYIIGYRTLSQDVEEGICQVLAHMWLETQIASISSRNGASTSSGMSSSKQGIRSPFERKLGDFFKHQIESDTSPIYGNGFRAGNQAVLKYGLERTLDHIRMTGTFPFWNIELKVRKQTIHLSRKKVGPFILVPWTMPYYYYTLEVQERYNFQYLCRVISTRQTRIDTKPKSILLEN